MSVIFLKSITLNIRYMNRQQELAMEFIIGRAGSGKTYKCIEDIRERIIKSPSGPLLLLLVPEHMTYRVEHELAEAMPDKGFMRVMVVGFRRFARHILNIEGGAITPHLSDIGKRLLIKSILEKNIDDLNIFKKAANKRGFSETLINCIEEFQGYGISPDELSNAAGGENTDFSKKIHELSFIYSRYVDEITGKYSDAGNMVDEAIERLQTSSMLDGAEAWIDGFIFFNPQEQEIVSTLLKRCKDLHITFTMDTNISRENSNETGIFHKSWETMRVIKQKADDMGVSVKFTYLDKAWRFHHSSLAMMEKCLFMPEKRDTVKDDSDEGESCAIHVVESATRRLEMAAVAADMIRLARDSGFRWCDMGILVRDEDSYEALGTVLSDYKIPYFIDQKRLGTHHPLAELIRSSLEAVRTWQRNPIIRAIRTEFFSITRNQADMLENYVREFGIRGKRWTMDEAWKWYRRHSLEETNMSESDADYLTKIDVIRRKATEPLKYLSDALKGAADAEDMTKALFDYLEYLNVPETLARWTDEANSKGMLDEAKEHESIWNSIMGLFDQIVMAGGKEKISLVDYTGLVEDGLDAILLGMIPPGLDYVTIAPFDQNSLNNLRAIYIVGANNGVMPRGSVEKGLLSDADRLYLRDAGLELPQGTFEGSCRERLLLYKGFTEATDYLWVSYPLADSEGGGLMPSPLVKTIRGMLPLSFDSLPLESSERQDMTLIAEAHEAVSGLSAALRGLREHNSIADFWNDIWNYSLSDESLSRLAHTATSGLFAKPKESLIPKQLAEKIYTKNKRLRASVTRFESFQECPFQHFSKYGLKLQEREKYKFQVPDLGNLLHEALAMYGRTLRDKHIRWSEVLEEDRNRIIKEIVDSIAPRVKSELLLSSAQYRNIIIRIEAAAQKAIRRLSAMDAVSKYHPTAFEKGFGKGIGSMPPLTYYLDDGYKMEITGQIDRIDVDDSSSEKYFLIIDYKSGSPMLNIIDVYYGIELQLLTYLLVVYNSMKENHHERIPAAILYSYIIQEIKSLDKKISKGEADKEIQNAMKMPGWILADPDVIRAIDSTQSFIKVKLKNDGGIYKANMKYVKSVEEFFALMSYVSILLEDTGRRIMAGDIKAEPTLRGSGSSARKACDLCIYKDICGFDTLIQGYNYREITSNMQDEEIMKEIEEKVSRTGDATMHSKDYIKGVDMV